MAAVNPSFAALSDEERHAAESRLVAFDREWDERCLGRQAQELPRDSSWRLPALAEMVKIDLERKWRSGRRVSLESYLQEFPELGSPGDVSADLIQAEYEVRRQFGAPAALEEYIRRFPNQAGELARRIALGGSALWRRSAAGELKSAPTPPDLDLDLPELFGRYRVIRRLGQGGMGSVYLAEDTRLQRRVALKVANAEVREDLDARRRLMAEARAAATLDHPYLCPVYDVGEVDGRLFLTMAYIDGQSLAEATGGNRLPPRQVAALAGKLALALQAAHAKGVIHRDLKPSNVMIKVTGSRREPVIVDFGLARRDNPNEARITRTGQVMGTLGYMAPEQLRGDLSQIGPACDIYALGVILYELLTGQLPFSAWGPALIGQILTQEPPPPSTCRPGLDPRLEAICLKAMAKTAASRYRTMAELAAALTEYLRAPAPSAPTPAPGPTAPPAGTDLLAARRLERVADEQTSAHPSHETLRSFGLGTLDDRAVSVVNEHLMECGDCRKRVAELSADSFLERVRDAQTPSAPATPTQSVSPAPAAAGETRWESMIDFGDSKPKSAVSARPARTGRPQGVPIAIGLVVLMLGLLALLGSVLKVKTPEGTIVLKNVPQGAQILVDGRRILYTSPGGGSPVEIRALPGRRKIEVKKDGITILAKDVTFKTNGLEEVAVRLEPIVEKGNTAPPETITKKDDVVPLEPLTEKDDAARREPSVKSDDPVPPETITTKADVVPPEPPTEQGSTARRNRLVKKDDAAGSGFIRLFNGKDLSGWLIQEGSPNCWQVVDGILTGTTQGDSHLFSERRDYRNFHLRAEARVNETGNSGVLFRAQPGFRDQTPEGDCPGFYEAQITGNPGAIYHTGSLLVGDKRFALTTPKALVPAYQWFVLEVIAEENHIVIKVDGATTADVAEDPRCVVTGQIALQKTPDVIVEFRTIEIMELNRRVVPGGSRSAR